MSDTAFRDLVHRVNNLLGTIQMQAEVARMEGTAAAYAAALQLIEASAQHTAEEVRVLVAASRTAGS